MKQKVLMVLLSLVSLTTAAFAQGSGNSEQQTLLRIEQEWVDASLKSDVAKLQTIYADSAVYVLSSGGPLSKNDYLSGLRSGAIKYTAMKTGQTRITLSGDTAIVLSRVTLSVKVGNATTPLDAAMMHVYVKLGGRWQLLAHQTTKLG